MYYVVVFNDHWGAFMNMKGWNCEIISFHCH